MTPSAIPPGAEVDPTFVASQLSDPSVRIVEVDVSSASYLAGHIPGAVLWNAYADLRHPDYQPISASELQDLLRRSGIAADTTVVVYGYGSHLATGCCAHVATTSCGCSMGRVSGGATPVTTGRATSLHPPVTVRRRHPVTVHRLQERRPGADGVIGRDHPRRPHPCRVPRPRLLAIGGARGSRTGWSHPGRDTPAGRLAPDERRRLQGSRRLQRVVQEYGLDPAVEIITYCTIGNRASQVWYALTALGYAHVSVYYGSWVEWGMAADAPIETG